MNLCLMLVNIRLLTRSHIMYIKCNVGYKSIIYSNCIKYTNIYTVLGILSS